ncbi:DNA-3-methyladenine glycosylase [Microbispora sp. NPDC049125]|uniref:DNA-3-methyladenine glycosylase family protein n=1 Tax=Microbispora sp. NPDC049125 TaxID=3154929 RepID=UPI003464F4D0
MTIRLTPRGPFSLAAAIGFQKGFAPADYRNHGGAPVTCSTGVAGDDESLRFAFADDADWRPGGARIVEDGADVLVEPHGQADPEKIAAQVARILSLDVDGVAFPEVGERDPVVGELQRRHPGLRPVCFHSPYEAAAWAVIGHRIQIRQAAGIRTRISQEHGVTVDVAGVAVPTFPAPERLLALDGVRGLPDVKIERLHAVARAALAGELDARTLRSLDPEEALARLCRIPGIGPFSADLILVRGAGAPDHFPVSERRLHDSMAAAYGLPEADIAALRRIAAGWSPFRSWVALLMRSERERTTGEIARGRRVNASAHQPVSHARPAQLRIGGED